MSAPVNDKMVLAAMDLGAHSARMLIAECSRKTGKIETLEDLDVFIPLGSNVFRYGKVSNESIQTLCRIFSNFKQKMLEYGVEHYRAIATSAVREAQNADILLERIEHATGIAIRIFEGTDEARLNYLTFRNVIPKKFDFDHKSTLIADIGTGACEVSSYENGALCFTETIKIGTLRVLEQMPDTRASSALRDFLVPVIKKAFGELRHVGKSLTSDYLIAMGASVRTLQLFVCPEKDKAKAGKNLFFDVSKQKFEEIGERLTLMSVEQISEQFGVSCELAEAVVPCILIVENLFRITGATRLIVPLLSMKNGLMQDFVNELLYNQDIFEARTLEAARTVSEKYLCRTPYSERTMQISKLLFDKLEKLHGLRHRDLLILEVAACLHKAGLFINNQAAHKHSFYIIDSTELPGISPAERHIAALTARYHRKSFPKPQHPEFAALSTEDKRRVWKLSAILRIACALALTGVNSNTLKIKVSSTKVLVQSDGAAPDLTEDYFKADLEYFSSVFAVRLNIE